jgi:predicted MFS family arabinose efflux permease
VTTLVRDRRTWLTYSQLGVYGWFLYGFGPALTLLRDEQGFSRTVAGLHGTALAVGALLSALVVAPLTARFGRVRLIWTGLLVMCVGIVVLCSFTVLPATLAGALLCAFGGSFVVTCTTTVLAALHHSAAPAAITEANAVAAGVGAVAPLAVAIALTLGSWRAALLVLLPVVGVLALTERRTPKPAESGATPDRGRSAPLGRRFWVSWVVVTAGIGVEFCLTLWSADMLEHRTGLSPAGASAAVTALVAGMCIGRTAGGRLSLRYAIDHLLYAGIALNLAGFALFWGTAAPAPAVTGLFACGVGLSLYYPLGMARSIAASEGRPDQASARVGLGAALASGVGPFLLGALADATSIHLAMFLVPCLLAVAAVGIRLAPARLPAPA